MCTDVALGNFFQRQNSARRRRQLSRPGFRVTIEPHRLHARLRRAHDIEMRVIANVQHLRGLNAGGIE